MEVEATGDVKAGTDEAAALIAEESKRVITVLVEAGGVL